MNKRILIVDDETNVRLNLRMTLETEGYEIFEARSAEQALDVLAEHSFVLAILDMRIPGDERKTIVRVGTPQLTKALARRTAMAIKTHSIFDPATILPAIGESFKKLNPGLA